MNLRPTPSRWHLANVCPTRGLQEGGRSCRDERRSRLPWQPGETRRDDWPGQPMPTERRSDGKSRVIDPISSSSPPITWSNGSAACARRKAVAPTQRHRHCRSMKRREIRRRSPATSGRPLAAAMRTRRRPRRTRERRPGQPGPGRWPHRLGRLSQPSLSYRSRREAPGRSRTPCLHALSPEARKRSMIRASRRWRIQAPSSRPESHPWLENVGTNR